MGISTKADDWVVAAHNLKVTPSKGSAVMSFKIGSVTANQAALLGCFGQISGSGIPNEQLFSFSSAFVESFGVPFSLKDIKGHRGSVSQNVPGITDSEMNGVAFRTNGKVMFNFPIPNSESMSFQMTGQWLVRMILPLRETFVIP
jgi:hypothetical protein